MSNTATTIAADIITLQHGHQGRPHIVMLPMPEEAADMLGPAFAAIDPWLSYPYPAALLTQFFKSADAGAPLYAIQSDGCVAGAVGLRLNWMRGPYVQFLGVLPAFQNQGIGGHVLRWLDQSARGRGERNLWVAASDFNGGAIRLYERHGFVQTAELDDLVADGKREILLRKRLTTPVTGEKA
jgi:diamine N-acetyltransferase